MIKKRSDDKNEVFEKRNGEGHPNFKKNGKFSKSGPNNRKYEDKSETRWCENLKVKHYGQCPEVVTCYRCGKIGRYVSKCTADKKLCFECE